MGHVVQRGRHLVPLLAVRTADSWHRVDSWHIPRHYSEVERREAFSLHRVTLHAGEDDPMQELRPQKPGLRQAPAHCGPKDTRDSAARNCQEQWPFAVHAGQRFEVSLGEDQLTLVRVRSGL